MTPEQTNANIDAADKRILYWALYRLLNAIHSARADDQNVSGPDRRGGMFNTVYFTADHWGPQIPGMPTADEILQQCRADDAHHERTYRAESMGLRVTGDEFI